MALLANCLCWCCIILQLAAEAPQLSVESTVLNCGQHLRTNTGQWGWFSLGIPGSVVLIQLVHVCLVFSDYISSLVYILYACSPTRPFSLSVCKWFPDSVKFILTIANAVFAQWNVSKAPLSKHNIRKCNCIFKSVRTFSLVGDGLWTMTREGIWQ